MALVALSDRSQARCCKRPDGPALSNGARARALLQARKRVGARHHWAGEAGSRLESLLEDCVSCVRFLFTVSQ